MPLTKEFVNDSWATCNYHVAEKLQFTGNDEGNLTIEAFISAAAYAGRARNQGEFNIPINDDCGDGMQDSDGVWTKLPWSQVGNGKTQNQRETYLKSGKIKYGTKTVDLSDAEGP